MGIIINSDLEKYRKYVKERLNKKRYIHSVGVAYTAANLAYIYDIDIDKARIAGILHDNAKCFDSDELIKRCKKENIPLSKYELEMPELIHSKLGSYIAHSELNINDNDVLNAITYHTTGRPNMSLLERIIYVADYIEPNRSNLDNMEYIRKCAYKDINEAIVLISESTINYINTKGCILDDLTTQTYEYYKGVLNNND